MNNRAYRRPIRQSLLIPFRGISSVAGMSRLAFMATLFGLPTLVLIYVITRR